jgi:hypothetical protein
VGGVSKVKREVVVGKVRGVRGVYTVEAREEDVGKVRDVGWVRKEEGVGQLRVVRG